MNYTCLLISLVCAILIVIYLHQTSDDNKKKRDTTHLLLGFVITFIIAYITSTLLLDTNDNSHILDNIKHGEPPF